MTITERFNSLTIFSLRSGALEMIFGRQACCPVTIEPWTKFNRFGLTCCATRLPGGAPCLISSVQLILTNQNEQPGYEAETQLCLDIVDRFPDVPWERRLHDALEADLSRDRDKPVIAPSHLGRSASDNASCECVGHARPPCNRAPFRTMIECSGRDRLSRLE